MQLLEEIDLDQLPVFLGGTCEECNGNCIPTGGQANALGHVDELADDVAKADVVVEDVIYKNTKK